MRDPLHLEEVHVIANLCQDVQQLQCVEAETATPETDRRSKHIPLITLCAVKRDEISRTDGAGLWKA